MHGSAAINEIELDLLRYLIERQNCRLVLFEYDIYGAMILNRFVSSDIEETVLDKTINSGASLIEKSKFKDFLLWLQKYNQEHPQDKVMIGGLLDMVINDDVLTDYLITYQTHPSFKLIEPVLQALRDRKITKAKQQSESSDVLKKMLGSDEYANFM